VSRHLMYESNRTRSHDSYTTCRDTIESFAPSMRVDAPMLSIVATLRRAWSRFGAIAPSARQAPLNSSILAMRPRISGVIVGVSSMRRFGLMPKQALICTHLATPRLAPDDTRKVPDLGFWGYEVPWRTTAPPSGTAETAAPSLILSASPPILFGVMLPDTAGSLVRRGNRARKCRIQPPLPFPPRNTGNIARRDTRTHVIRPLVSHVLASQSRASGLQYHQVFVSGAPNSLKRNPAIECYESSAIANGEAEQIHVSDLPRTMNPRCIEYCRIKETRRIRPVCVDALSARFGQPPHERLNGLRVGIRRARHDANTAILGQRT
jgi:hypothetical protein